MDVEPIVKVRDISMIYGNGTHALDSVTLDIPKGKLVTFLGPSGCGKTSLLKIIAGLLKPTSGEIRINNKTTYAPGPDRALVFQDFALMPWADTMRNVAFGLELRGMARAERHRIAQNILRKSDLRVSRRNILMNSLEVCVNAPGWLARSPSMPTY